MPQLTILREQRKAQHYIEDLGKGVKLEMVLIPGGSFMMGSPEDEEGYSSAESPQHSVTIKPFFMGKYPVTQAQWQAVASLPKVKQQLKRDPSKFKGADRPVENVSWNDAVEFCDRLTRKTKRKYRLPSEAEWEYACRAGTTTPFHFGKTITTDLANYCGEDETIGGTLYKGSYGVGTTGISRQETTPVGSFGVANAYGLYDMHGNVREWCMDHWHKDYKGAPTDGSAWLNNNDNDNSYRLLRGGSWADYPPFCRSACRNYFLADYRDSDFGFRVACAGARTQ